MTVRRKTSIPKKLIQVHSRLFDTDVKELKRQARQEMVPWQTKLRALVHEALSRIKETIV